MGHWEVIKNNNKNHIVNSSLWALAVLDLCGSLEEDTVSICVGGWGGGEQAGVVSRDAL